MTETQTTPAATVEPKPFNGRAFLLAKLQKNGDEILKVTPICGALYRCTWFVPIKIGDVSRNNSGGQQGQVSRSAMIRCSKEGEIEPLPKQ